MLPVSGCSGHKQECEAAGCVRDTSQALSIFHSSSLICGGKNKAGYQDKEWLCWHINSTICFIGKALKMNGQCV